MLECRCFSRARPARTLVLDHPRPLNLMGPGHVRTVGPSPFALTFASVPRLRTASTHSPRPSCYLPRPGYTPSVSPASTPTSFTSSITSTALCPLEALNPSIYDSGPPIDLPETLLGTK